MARTILVTGGAGYIGSHVCKMLAASGYTPVTYDNLSTGHFETVRWGPIIVGDLRDEETLDAAFRNFRPEAVIHLAGYIAAGESVRDPAKYYRNNMEGTLALLDAMYQRDVDSLVFSSSAAVYGAPEVAPVPEDAPIRPTTPYGHTKAMAEQVIADYAVYGLRATSLRYFNAAGADPDGELGEMHDPETHLIPLVLEAAAGLRPRIDVFGTEHPTRDGTCVRDYIHVHDLAAAHVLALRHQHETPGATAYNLGNGRGVSVQEVIAAVEAVTGHRVPTQHCPARPGDPPTLVADAKRAGQALGWDQAYGDLTDQIRHAWAFLDRRRDALRPAG